MRELFGETKVFVLPAYNRNYVSEDEALQDWFTGKDFKIANGPYFSIRDTKTLIASGITSLCLVWDVKQKRTMELLK
jgi:hypothetical protein